MLAPFVHELEYAQRVRPGRTDRVRHEQSVLVFGGVVWVRLAGGGAGGATDATDASPCGPLLVTCIVKVIAVSS